MKIKCGQGCKRGLWRLATFCSAEVFRRRLQGQTLLSVSKPSFSPWLSAHVVTGAVKSCCFSQWSSAVMKRRKFSSRGPSTRSESASLSNRWGNPLRLSLVLKWLLSHTHTHILTRMYFSENSPQADEIEKILCHKFMRFMMMRAENFFILRRKPVEVRAVEVDAWCV